MELLLLIIFGSLAIVTSAMVIFARNTVHSALWMVGTFIAIAAVFILLHAQFLAILQIIVYAGAIMMFIIYAIMMLNLRQENADRMPVSKTKLWGLGLVMLFMLLLLFIGLEHTLTALQGPVTGQFMEQYGHVAVLSNYLFSDYLLPFEVASILLTAGVVGAVVLARRK